MNTLSKERKRELRDEYEHRRPVMGIVCWMCGDRMWIAASTDVVADQGSTSFQLKMGSWPNRAMQQAYNENPEGFQWSVLKELDYKERTDDHRDDLQTLYDLCLLDHPQAQRMRLSNIIL